MFDIPAELKKLPQKPGVYLMKDADGVIIYVGKAVSLRSRVRQYFRGGHEDGTAAGTKTAHLVGHIAEFEYIVTDTELEALILERNLIKKHTPKYNILLKDDKNYFPYLKLSVDESFPRLYMTRRHLKDKAKYYGPYAGGAIKETLELVQKIWPLRRCAKKFPFPAGSRPCLNYHIGLCSAPCCGLVTEAEYAKAVDEVADFLGGNRQPVLSKLERQMAGYAEALEFEKAAELRDALNAVKGLDDRQKIENAGGDDKDVIALTGGFGGAAGESAPAAGNGGEAPADLAGTAVAQIFFIRGGKLIGRENYMVSVPQEEPPERTLSEFIKQFYGENTFIPKEIILAHDIADSGLVAEWLTGLKGRNVTMTVPRRGEKLKLARMAETNAEIAYKNFGHQMKRELDRTTGALAELAGAMGLPPFRRIEAYDISNTQGYESVASMVVFDNGLPKRSDYRKFRIKTVVGANDPASIEEVVKRRFSRYIAEHESGVAGKFSTAPDILFIDGGKLQQQAAEGALKGLGIGIPVCGMVKDDRHRTRGLYYGGNEITLPYTSEGFKLLTRIQDEVHRFAIEYHRKLREKESVRSVLDGIPGIGPARRKALMNHFGSIEAVRKAGEEELEKAPAMNRAAAKAVYSFFHNS